MSPRPGSLRSHDGQDFWRGLAVVTLDVGSISIRHSASSRLASAGALPPDQNQRLVAASTRLAGAPPALISADWNGADWNGADWNTECADRIPSAGRLELYELADPYAEVGWFADLIH
jgi:hypothetical protein